MHTLSIIFSVGFVASTFVSWLIWAFWMTGSLKKPNFFAARFHSPSVYRAGIEEARSRGCSARTIRIFEWAYGSALVCFVVVVLLVIVKVLRR